MDRLLVATDLSDRSRHALDRAKHIAADTGAQITVLTVLDEDLPEALAEAMAVSARTLLDDLVGTDMDVRVSFGDPAMTVSETAEEIGADLIVIGPHRRRVIFDALRETTAERIVRLARRPVLLARTDATAPYTHVLAPTDFSAPSARAIRRAHALAPNADIKVVHAVHVPAPRHGVLTPALPFVKEAEAHRDRWLAQSVLPDGTAPPEIHQGGLGHVVEIATAEAHATLIALGSHARDGIGYAVLGSFARDMIRGAETDLLLAA